MKQDYPRKHLSSDKYETDSWVRSMFPSTHWYDPCPIDWKPGDPDGLVGSWHKKMNTTDLGIFVNPPYSNPLPWVEKAIFTNQVHCETVVMLLKHDSSTEWYRLLHEAGANMMLFNKRLKYGTNTGAAFPSVLVVLE